MAHLHVPSRVTMVQNPIKKKAEAAAVAEGRAAYRPHVTAEKIAFCKVKRCRCSLKNTPLSFTTSYLKWLDKSFKSIMILNAYRARIKLLIAS